MFRTVLLCSLALSLSIAAAEKKSSSKPKKADPAVGPVMSYEVGDFVEPSFPFFSSVLDARAAGEGSRKDNLTPRGLIMNLGRNLWACFDTDLLRIACVWKGEPGKPPITLNGLAPGSYHVAGQKTKDGQDDLPQPVGKVWLANGIYPGWQVLPSPEAMPSVADPRAPAPDRGEVGKGPVDEKFGRFKSMRLIKADVHRPIDSICLELEVAGADVRETVRLTRSAGRDGEAGVEARVTIAPTEKTLALASACVRAGSASRSGGRGGAGVWSRTTDQIKEVRVPIPGSEAEAWFVVIPPHSNTIEFACPLMAPVPDDLLGADRLVIDDVATARWPETITTKAALSAKDDAYVVDDIPLPLSNPWKRNVRLADIAFLNAQGEAAAVTMDGDVWLISGLTGDLGAVKWRRYASGLHEPMSIVARDKQLFVFDRNGIWRFADTNGDGECDRYEMFCNLFAQTAETREFPNAMKLAPDGSLVICKGGQQGTTLGKHNGTAIRVAPDGRSFEVIGYGLRQPFIGVHPKTGMVVASDQEGNYVPTTPVHVIKDHQFYGHLATIQPHEEYPQSIADPLTWIPHAVVASGATLTWLADAKMGSINDELILVSYNKPELHRVLVSNRPGHPQAADVPWIKNFDFPTLNAHVNPADGQLYAVGFQIWGTTVKRISGLARVRYTGMPRVLLTECTPCDKGVLLRFNMPLDKAAATNPDNYNVERWSYKRTFNYGSPHLKQDGTPGQEWMVPSSAYLSKDSTCVFVGLPNMKNSVMQMRLGYGLKGAEGLPAQNNVYFTPYELIKFDPEREGFEQITIDLTPRKMTAAAQVRPTLEEGRRLYEMMGCMACHSIDGTTYAKVGPSWKGLFGSERMLAKGGERAVANESYLRESIQNPAAKVVKGYEKLDTGMPIYAGVLTDAQIDSLILFIKSLK